MTKGQQQLQGCPVLEEKTGSVLFMGAVQC